MLGAADSLIRKENLKGKISCLVYVKSKVPNFCVAPGPIQKTKRDSHVPLSDTGRQSQVMLSYVCWVSMSKYQNLAGAWTGQQDSLNSS